ncbi:hypothetical protein [Pontibacter sp. H249]|uniref:hypothetical protein n=1 Tax=Pontibacter sp. H249 TaxID=3133420 RepID=UPI0030BB0954
MAVDYYTDVLGDLFIHEMNIDFISKSTTLAFGYHPESHQGKTHELKFTGVVWQEFRNFNCYNVLFDIEVTEDFAEFRSREKDYLKSMKGYFPIDILNEIEKDKSLHYFFIGTSVGVEGFVICKEASVKEIGVGIKKSST